MISFTSTLSGSPIAYAAARATASAGAERVDPQLRRLLDLRHPEVGPLTLAVQTFDVRAAPGQQLVVYHAEAGSSSSRALTLLGSLEATRAAVSPA